MGLRLGDGNQWNDAGPHEHALDQKEENCAMKGGGARAPAASAGAVKPDIVDGEAVLPNHLLACMYRPLDFMVYSPYEFSGV